MIFISKEIISFTPNISNQSMTPYQRKQQSREVLSSMRMEVIQLVLTLTCLLTESQGFNHAEQFIRDVLNSQKVDQCDFGYVFEHNDPKMTPQIVASLNER